MFVHVHVPINQQLSIQSKHQKACISLLHTLRHYRPAPNVTVTLTRQNLEAAVYCSKIDRLHVLQILICLCGRSTEQVPAGVVDPCGILAVNNIIIKT